MLARLKSFSLSAIEMQGVELLDEYISIGMEERRRSLKGNVFREKRINFVGIKSSMMKLWQHRGLCKVVGIAQNVYQFTIDDASERDGVMQGRPWAFDNHLLVLQLWEENLSWNDECFNVFSI